MQSWMVEMMEQYGYVGIFLLIAFENIFPPIPSEVILTFGGTMTTFSTLTVPGVVLAATAGSLTGAVILYKIGNLLDVGRLEKIIDRWGRILHLDKKIFTKRTDGLTIMAIGQFSSAGLFRSSAVLFLSLPVWHG